MSTGLGRARALAALAELGLPSHGLVRADSVTNEVWVTDEHVVRLNRDASPRLHREAILSQALPPEVGYPPLVQYGGEAGGDWLIAQRLPGRPLSRSWPAMEPAARREAVRQLAVRLKAVHATRCPVLGGAVESTQLIQRAPSGRQAVAPLLDAVERATRLPNVDRLILHEVSEFVAAHASALDPFDDATMVHGDVTFENVIWDGEKVTALLDFEFARPGCPDLDLDVLLRFCALPKLHVAADYEDVTEAADYEDVPWWLAEDYPELFAHPRQFDRMRIYSLATDIRELLAYPPTDQLRDLHPFHPHRRMVYVLRGTSYLDRMNGSVTIDY